eukprot:31427-Pelagococcus_subviridis.AAC.3
MGFPRRLLRVVPLHLAAPRARRILAVGCAGLEVKSGTFFSLRPRRLARLFLVARRQRERVQPQRRALWRRLFTVDEHLKVKVLRLNDNERPRASVRARDVLALGAVDVARDRREPFHRERRRLHALFHLRDAVLIFQND